MNLSSQLGSNLATARRRAIGFTGLSCASYTRISSFSPFFDQAYKKGGQEVLEPAFDCVAPNPNGTLTARFGYDNLSAFS